jgi:hypothetical protein
MHRRSWVKEIAFRISHPWGVTRTPLGSRQRHFSATQQSPCDSAILPLTPTLVLGEMSDHEWPVSLHSRFFPAGRECTLMVGSCKCNAWAGYIMNRVLYEQLCSCQLLKKDFCSVELVNYLFKCSGY